VELLLEQFSFNKTKILEKKLLLLHLFIYHHQVTGVDIRLNYNPDLVEITSIEKGTNIGALDSQIINTFDNVTGKISYAVYTANKENAITGSSIEILTINGNVKDTASGNATFSFDPTTVISGISEGQNVIINSSSGSIIISSNESTTIPTATTTNTANATPTAVTTTTSTVTSGSTTTATSTATSTATATATSTASGQPNSCNGTCGSNSNCSSGLFCYSGYCRNSSCPTDTDCVCNGTATPTSTSTSIAQGPTSTSEPQLPEAGTSWPTILGTGFGIFIILGALLLAL